MNKLPSIVLAGALIFPGAAVLTAVPAQAVVSAPAAAEHLIPADNSYQVQEIFDEINKFRATKGLKPVKYNIYAAEVSQEWSNHMGSANDFSHNPKFANDPRISGWSNAGEIIAGNYNRSGKSLVDQWIKSPGHNAIMSNPNYNTVGVGVSFTNGAEGRMSIYGTVNFYQFNTEKPGTYANPAASKVKQSFNDVFPDNQFFKEIEWMNSSGISTGYTDGTYRPYQPVNRDAMAAFLYRAAGSPAYTPPRVSPFNDITPSTPFYKEITWLANSGITTGYTDGTYRPYQPVNRDAMAAFLYRAAGSPAYTAPKTSPFKDIPTTNQFYKEISWLASTGISTGWSDNTYRAYQPVNRDAMAAFLYRYDQKF